MKKILMFLLLFNLMGLTACNDVKEEPVLEKEVVLLDKESGYKLIRDNYLINLVGRENTYLGSTINYKDGIHELVSSLEKCESEDKLSYAKVMKDINSKKRSFISETSTINKNPDYYYGDSNYRKLSVEVKNKGSRGAVKNGMLSVDQMMYDLNYYDSILREHYGPYKFFGKEKFNEAYYKAEEEINKTNGLRIGDFENIMQNAYSFIQDRHFYLGSGSLDATIKNGTDGFYYDDFYFLKDDKGYYLKDYSPKTYLTKFNDDSKISSYLHYAIEDSGELAYMISTTLNELDSGKVEIELGGKLIEIFLKQMNGAYDVDSHDGSLLRAKDSDSFVEIDGYPVITNRIYRSSEGITPNFSRYKNVGGLLRNEDVVIHDTRSNGGGQSRYYSDFYRAICKEPTTIGEKYNDENTIIYKGGHNRKVSYPYASIIKNDDYIYTLTDANSGSSGDGVVLVARVMENNIVVGEPTSGTMLAGNTYKGNLPNSNIQYACGTHIKYCYGTSHMPDGYGLIPDIWVKSVEALDRTVRMLEYYDVKPSPTSKEIVKKNGFNTNNCRFDIDEYASLRNTNTYKYYYLDFDIKNSSIRPIVKVYNEERLSKEIELKVNGLEEVKIKDKTYYKLDNSLLDKEYQKISLSLDNKTIEVNISKKFDKTILTEESYYLDRLKKNSDPKLFNEYYLLVKRGILGVSEEAIDLFISNNIDVEKINELKYKFLFNDVNNIDTNHPYFNDLLEANYNDVIALDKKINPDKYNIYKIRAFLSNSSKRSDGKRANGVRIGNTNFIDLNKDLYCHFYTDLAELDTHLSVYMTSINGNFMIGNFLNNERLEAVHNVDKSFYNNFPRFTLVKPSLVVVNENTKEKYEISLDEEYYFTDEKVSEVNSNVKVDVVLSNIEKGSKYEGGLEVDGVKYLDSSKKIYATFKVLNFDNLDYMHVVGRFNCNASGFGTGLNRMNVKKSFPLTFDTNEALKEKGEFKINILIYDDNDKLVSFIDGKDSYLIK